MGGLDAEVAQPEGDDAGVDAGVEQSALKVPYLAIRRR